MAGSSLAAALDWLVASCRTAVTTALTNYNTANGTALTGNVWETWPLVDDPVIVTVGRRDPGDDTGFEFTSAYELLGARRRTERPSIPFIIQAAVGGNRSVSDARALAVAVLDGVILAVKQDPTLGGLLVGGVALIDQVRYSAVRDDEDAKNGRSVMLTGALTYQHQYIPS